MATNLALDDQLLDEALKIGNLKTKKDTVTTALQEFIKRRKQIKFLELAGSFEFDPTYNYKQERSR